jgi:integrase
MTALQHQQLLAQTKVFRNQLRPGPENCRNSQCQKPKYLRAPPPFHQGRLACDLSTQNPSDHVIAPYRTTQQSERINTARKAAGIQRVTFHGWRHIYAL